MPEEKEDELDKLEKEADKNTSEVSIPKQQDLEEETSQQNVADVKDAGEGEEEKLKTAEEEKEEETKAAEEEKEKEMEAAEKEKEEEMKAAKEEKEKEEKEKEEKEEESEAEEELKEEGEKEEEELQQQVTPQAKNSAIPPQPTKPLPTLPPLPEPPAIATSREGALPKEDQWKEFVRRLQEQDNNNWQAHGDNKVELDLGQKSKKSSKSKGKVTIERNPITGQCTYKAEPPTSQAIKKMMDAFETSTKGQAGTPFTIKGGSTDAIKKFLKASENRDFFVDIDPSLLKKKGVKKAYEEYKKNFAERMQSRDGVESEGSLTVGAGMAMPASTPESVSSGLVTGNEEAINKVAKVANAFNVDTQVGNVVPGVTVPKGMSALGSAADRLSGVDMRSATPPVPASGADAAERKPYPPITPAFEAGIGQKSGAGVDVRDKALTGSDQAFPGEEIGITDVASFKKFKDKLDGLDEDDLEGDEKEELYKKVSEINRKIKDVYSVNDKEKILQKELTGDVCKEIKSYFPNLLNPSLLQEDKKQDGEKPSI